MKNNRTNNNDNYNDDNNKRVSVELMRMTTVFRSTTRVTSATYWIMENMHKTNNRNIIKKTCFPRCQ